MSPHGVLAVPEAENLSGGPYVSGEALVARVLAIADELARQQTGVDWEDDLERGGGPCLALGAERRCAPR
jgi:hypothetical protein